MGNTAPRGFLLVVLLWFSPLVPAKEPAMRHPTEYHTVQIDGIKIFYREAPGYPNAAWLSVLVKHVRAPIRASQRSLPSDRA